MKQELQELMEAIRRIPEQELRNLLRELAERDVVLRNRLLIQYSDKIGEMQIMRLKKEVEGIADRYCEYDGYVSWQNVYPYKCAMESFLEEHIPVLIKKGCYMQAFELTNTVFLKSGGTFTEDVLR